MFLALVSYTTPNKQCIRHKLAGDDGIEPSLWLSESPLLPLQQSPINGGAMGSRTPDLLTASETLYQLSYSPVKWCSIWEFNPSFINRSISSVPNAHVTNVTSTGQPRKVRLNWSLMLSHRTTTQSTNVSRFL